MDDMEVIVTEELRACRVCLATDARLVDLFPEPLAEMLVDITRIPVSTTDGMPQHLCSMCAALLKNAAAFKNRCLCTHTLLTSGMSLGQYCNNKITMSQIREIDKKTFMLPYILTDTLILNVTDDDCNREEVKEKNYETNKVSLESFEESVLDEVPMELPTIKEETSADTNIIKTERDETASKNPKRKQARVAATTNDKKQENLKSYLFKCQRKTKDLNKKLFYRYVLDKYHFKNKVSQTNDYACDVDDDTAINIVDVDKSANEMVINTESDRNVFFNYITKKYVKRNVEMITNVVDVTGLSLRVSKIKHKESVSFNHSCKGKVNLEEFAKTHNFEIVKLTKNDQRMEHEELKQSLLYNKPTLKCDECFTGFETESAFKDHMALHDPSNGSHACDVCKLRYPTAAKLINHALWHATKFVCNECKSCFKSIPSAREHYKSHAGGASCECEHCAMKISKPSSRTKNYRVRRGATSCDVCYERFQTVRGVNRHKAMVHKQTYQCDKCSVHFDNPNALKWHLSQSPDGTCDPSVRACAKCGDLCATYALFFGHTTAHTRVALSKTRLQGVGKCRCVPCGTVFRSGEALRKHLETSPDNTCQPGTRSCDQCGVNFPSEDLLQEHGSNFVHLPSGATEYKCEKCDARFKNKKLHLKHRTLHKMGEAKVAKGNTMKIKQGNAMKIKQKWICDVCGLSWQSLAALKYHQRVHTGEKPHQCPECPKSFRMQDALQVHMNTHTGACPYKCPHCPKAFKSNSLRHRHQQVHTGEKRYSCPECHKTFTQSNSMKLHVRTVHLKLPAPYKSRARSSRAGAAGGGVVGGGTSTSNLNAGEDRWNQLDEDGAGPVVVEILGGEAFVQQWTSFD